MGCIFWLCPSRLCFHLRLSLAVPSPMADSKLALFKEAWQGGKHGSLSGQAQAHLWGFRKAWTDSGKGPYGLLTHAASKLKKVGRGNPTKPSQAKKDNQPTNQPANQTST